MIPKVILELKSIVLLLPPCWCCSHPNTSPSNLGTHIDLALPRDIHGWVSNEAQTFYPSLQEPTLQFCKFYLILQSLPLNNHENLKIYVSGFYIMKWAPGDYTCANGVIWLVCYTFCDNMSPWDNTLVIMKNDTCDLE